VSWSASARSRRTSRARSTCSISTRRQKQPVRRAAGITASKLLDESLLDERLELARSIETLDGRIRRLSALETQQKNLIEALSVWQDFDVPLETAGTQYTSIILGGVPATIQLDNVERALGEAVPRSGASAGVDLRGPAPSGARLA
jgi:hypothetical protein